MHGCMIFARKLLIPICSLKVVDYWQLREISLIGVICRLKAKIKPFYEDG